MIKEFNNLEEIQKYYDKETNTYIFKEGDKYIDLIKFNFDLVIFSNISALDVIARKIDAYDIDVWNINAWDIDSHVLRCDDINAWDIKANYIYAENINALNIYAIDIFYYAVCFAYKSIKCNLIKGSRTNARHFVLDGFIKTIEFEREDK